MSTRKRRPVQGGLWGRRQAVPVGPGRGSTASNDLDPFAAVAQTAIDPGYVLIGPAKRVFRHDPSRTGHVEPVPTFEAALVAQLLDSHHLAIGGTHHVTHGRHDGPARSVLVPRATRDLVGRWAHLRRPTSWPLAVRPGHSQASGSGCGFCHDTGRIPDSGQTSWSPEKGLNRPRTSSPCPRCQPATRP